MKKINFDQGWEFAETAGMFAQAFVQWQQIDLPHDVSITKSRSQNHPTGAAGGYAWSGIVTYRKKFQAPADWQGQQLLAEFDGIYMNAEVSLNGQLIALHPYGYTSFLADLTPYTRFGAENVMTVVVNNSAQPNSRWYSGMGIYRHVWLRMGPAGLHIKPWGVFVTTPVVDREAAMIHVATEVTFAQPKAVLRSTVQDDGGVIISQAENPISNERLEQHLLVKTPHLWSVDEPRLYTLVSEIIADGQVQDSEKTVFGIRSIAVNAKNGFRLNGVPMKLKGGCVHHDNGLLGSASYDRAEERKIELMKASGYNAIRCAHNPPAPAMLDACDRLGMLVIDETFDCWRMGKNPNDYHLYFEDWWQRDTESMVKRDRNHPSIIMWSIGNEMPERTGASDGYAWSRRQADYVRSLDPTRWVTSALPFLYEEMVTDPDFLKKLEDAQDMFDPRKLVPTDLEIDQWGNRTQAFVEPLDVVGYNYLFARYEWDGKRFPERVIAGTETFPYLAYEFWKETDRLPFVIGDFVWTAIDYLGESGIGRVSIDDPTPFFAMNHWPYHLATCGDIDICGFKRPQSYYRDLLWGVRTTPYIAVQDPNLAGKKLQFNQWGWDPVSDCWTFPGQEGQSTRVDVYSIDDEVELLINGATMGRKPAGASCQNKTSFDVAYQPGILEAIGYQAGKETGRARLVTAGEPATLQLAPDHAKIKAGIGCIAYVDIVLVDKNSVEVKHLEPEITVEVSGAGTLLALGTANPLSEELYVQNHRKAHQGHLMAVVRSSGLPGEITLTARLEGLPSAQVHLQTF